MLFKNETMQQNLTFAQSILDTLREPFVVLDSNLRVLTVSRSFYDTFRVSQKHTEGRLFFELGDGHWDIPVLRKIVEADRSRGLND